MKDISAAVVGLLKIIREKKIITEAQIKELLDRVKLANLEREKHQA